MNEINSLIDKFLNSLNSEKIVKDLKTAYNDVYEDSNLMNNLEKYQNTYNKSLKEELLSNEKIKRARKCEAELNYIILEINQELKKITHERGKCI